MVYCDGVNFHDRNGLQDDVGKPNRYLPAACSEKPPIHHKSHGHNNCVIYLCEEEHHHHEKTHHHHEEPHHHHEKPHHHHEELHHHHEELHHHHEKPHHHHEKPHHHYEKLEKEVYLCFNPCVREESKHSIKKPKKRPRSYELRNSILMKNCECDRRNGLQDQCPRTGCQGSPKCYPPPPSCPNCQFSLNKHWVKVYEKMAKHHKELKEQAFRKEFEKYEKGIHKHKESSSKSNVHSTICVPMNFDGKPCHAKKQTCDCCVHEHHPKKKRHDEHHKHHYDKPYCANLPDDVLKMPEVMAYPIILPASMCRDKKPKSHHSSRHSAYFKDSAPLKCDKEHPYLISEYPTQTCLKLAKVHL